MAAGEGMIKLLTSSDQQKGNVPHYVPRHGESQVELAAGKVTYLWHMKKKKKRGRGSGGEEEDIKYPSRTGLCTSANS